MTDLPIFVLDREFDAPRERVWRAWTDPKLLSEWYGPNVETIIHKLDVSLGGLWLNEMRMGGQSHYQRAEFTEVSPHDRLVCLMSSSDENWNIIASSMMEDWPRTLETTVTLERSGKKTVLRLTWVPYQASEAEIACFNKAMGGAAKGWESGLDILERVLEETD